MVRQRYPGIRRHRDEAGTYLNDTSRREKLKADR